MKDIIKSISSIIIVATLMTTNVFCEEKSIIAGEDRFETAIEISKSWEASQEAILVNSTAIPDLLCATVLSSQIDCPILLTNKTKINEATNNEIKRLKANKLYLIGGQDVIHETIEKELNKNNINTERIHGQDRYETSIKVANKINELKKSNTVILVNGEYSVADAVSISPVAGNKNMPVIICKDRDIKNQIEWMENNNIRNSYIIGGKDVIHETIEEELKKDNINTERIYGKDRYETNTKVIENFYKESKIDKLFYCNGTNSNKEDEIIDGMLAAPLASKEKSPIILLGENLSEQQKDIIKKKNIKSLIQVGYGVSEESKNELYKLKENYTSPNLDDSLTSKPSQPEEPPILEQEKPSQPELPPTTDSEESNQPEEIPPIETEKEDLKYVDYTIDDKKKIISLNFNKKIDTSKESIKELKESIRIVIDENNIQNNNISEDKDIENNKDIENYKDHEEKYIKLNKYDNVRIEDKSLIVELDEELIRNSTIVISADTIKDSDNNYLEELKVKILDGVEKNIAFVKTEEELNKYINDKEVNIIKLENDIKLTNKSELLIRNDITIDGINEEENFKIYTELNSFSMQLFHHNITLKNLDLEGIYIEINNKENISLKNMKIDLKDKTLINIYKSIVYCENLILLSNKCGIEVTASSKSDISSKRSTLIIGGYIYNEKINEENKYRPTIILENRTKDINSDKLNKIVVKNEDNNIEYMFTKEIKDTNEDGTVSDKTYQIYYKK